MIQIRNNVFETNSSSTHSLCISKQEPVNKPLHMEFYLDYFGWEEKERSPSDYIYTAIMAHDIWTEDGKKNKWLPRLRSFLIENDVTWYFEEPDNDSEWFRCDFGIDHDYEVFPLIDELLDDHDMLARALFNNNSIVYTGNDNVDGAAYDKSTVGHEYHYVREDNVKKPDGDDFDELISYYNSGNWVRKKTGNWDNPYYDPDDFDYIYKGN